MAPREIIRVKPIVEYQSSQRVYFIANALKLIYLAAGLWISWSVLYTQCLFNPSCNTFIILFFELLALFCFEAAGIPVSKFLNVVVSTANDAKKAVSND